LIKGLACSTGSFPSISPLAVRVAVLRLLGFTAIDVLVTDLGEPSTAAMFSDDRIGRQLRAVCEREEMSVSDVFLVPGAGFEELAANHPHASAREAFSDLFERALLFAKTLDSPGVTILPGLEWASEDRAQSLARAQSELARHMANAHGKGLELSVEPHRWSLVASPAAVVELLDGVPGLKLTLDYSHFVYQGTAQDSIEPLLGHSRHLHMRGAREGKMHTILEQNMIDFKRIFEVLSQIDYAGYVALEYEPVQMDRGDADPYDVVSETVRLRDLLADYARRQ
jgi:sugar phosphate isomerase/epimerase